MRRPFLASVAAVLLAGCAATPLQQAAISPPGREEVRELIEREHGPQHPAVARLM